MGNVGSSVDGLCEALCDTLIETNHTYDFFVNWTKVAQNRDIFKYEVALLKSLRNSSNPVADFRKLLGRSGMTDYVRRRMALSFQNARALHALRFCFSPALRAYVARKDYLK